MILTAMEKKSQLILAQVDNISGEVLGFALEKLMELGAHNVQIIPTITKKSRPGSIILIDASLEKENAVAEFLAKELKISGYHKIDTSHVFQKVSFVKKNILLSTNGEKTSLHCTFKVVGDISQPFFVDVEHDFLVEAQKIIHEISDRFLSLDELRNRFESSFNDSVDDITIEI
jgi:hypothetical protein